MNELLKIVLSGCGIILLLALNSIAFDALFKLDMNYAKNIGWQVLFASGMTAIEIAIVRLLFGKLKIQLVWE